MTYCTSRQESSALIRVREESARRGGTIITDLRTRDRSYWEPRSLIFWLNEYEVSANASRPLPPNEATAPLATGAEGEPTPYPGRF
jgi:hypothetical protein